MGFAWPGADWSILVLSASFLFAGLGAARLCRAGWYPATIPARRINR